MAMRAFFLVEAAPPPLHLILPRQQRRKGSLAKTQRYGIAH
jgi:hypothetical protein